MLSLELIVEIPPIFSCPADRVPDWQPRILLGMVEARSINVKNTHTHTHIRQRGLARPKFFLLEDGATALRDSLALFPRYVRVTSATRKLVALVCQCTLARGKVKSLERDDVKTLTA